MQIRRIPAVTHIKILFVEHAQTKCLYAWKLIIPELRVLVLTKRHVGSGNEIAFMAAISKWHLIFLELLIPDRNKVYAISVYRNFVKLFYYEDNESRMAAKAVLR